MHTTHQSRDDIRQVDLGITVGIGLVKVKEILHKYMLLSLADTTYR